MAIGGSVIGDINVKLFFIIFVFLFEINQIDKFRINIKTLVMNRKDDIYPRLLNIFQYNILLLIPPKISFIVPLELKNTKCH